MPADDDSGTLDSSASQERKLSVLEQFGYQIQSVIGKGTYAKVKVIYCYSSFWKFGNNILSNIFPASNIQGT